MDEKTLITEKDLTKRSRTFLQLVRAANKDGIEWATKNDLRDRIPKLATDLEAHDDDPFMRVRETFDYNNRFILAMWDNVVNGLVEVKRGSDRAVLMRLVEKR